MNVNNIMKAKAWVTALLICMVSLVGFGQTTADPTRNSTTIVTDNDVGEMVIVVNQTLTLEEVFTYESNDYQMEVERYKKGECEYLKFGEVKPKIKINENIVDDVGWQSTNEINKNKTLLAATDNNHSYRKARDGLSNI